MPRGQVRFLPGGKAALEIFPARAGALLFYPGSMLAPGHYFVLIRALLDAGFAVAALHLPGHGLCRGHWWQTFTFAQLHEAGLLAEEYLRRLRWEHIAVGGHSQGAILALAHASRRIQAILAISGAFPQMEEAAAITRLGVLSRWRRQITATIGMMAAIAPALPVPLPAYLQLGRILRGRRRPVLLGRDAGRVAYPIRYLHTLFAASISPVLPCPVLLLGAVNDGLFPPELLQKVYDLIDAPHKELILSPDGGHMAPYNDGVARFLARHMAAFCAGHGFPIYLQTRG